jgi:hypothetical protein
MKTLVRKSVKKQRPKSKKGKTLKELLLEAPMMTDEQYKEYKASRQQTNKLRIKKPNRAKELNIDSTAPSRSHHD